MEQISTDVLIAHYFLYHPENKNEVLLGTLYKLKEVLEHNLAEDDIGISINFTTTGIEDAIHNNNFSLFERPANPGKTIVLKDREKLVRQADYFDKKICLEAIDAYKRISHDPNFYQQIDRKLAKLKKELQVI